MSLFEVGRLAVKIAGRDAGRKCVVVEQIDDTFVVVDGDVRRKKVNVKHLEPLTKVVELKEKASHADVKKVFEKLGFLVWERKSKKTAERPKKQRKVKQKKPIAEKKSKETKKKEVKPEVKGSPKPVEDVLKKEVKKEENSGKEAPAKK